MKKLLKSLTETQKEASDFLANLKAGQHATVVALYGDLGAGKTTFVKSLILASHAPHDVTSPTFVLMKKYPVSFGGFKNLIHIDAYRIEKEGELERLGWEDLCRNPENIILIEWPERVLGLIPKGATILKFVFVDENTREIEYL